MRIVGKRCRSSRHRLPVVLLLVLLFGVVTIQYTCPTDSKCHARLQVGSWFHLGGSASGSGGGEGSGRSPKDPYVAEDGALARFVPRYNFSQEDLSRVVDFNIKGDDVIVFLHIQKTGGTMFGRHLVQNMHLERPCECHKRKNRCACFRPGTTETWLFSRLSTGWLCGLHADWTELTSCVPSRMDSQEAPSNLPRNYFYITILRDPVLRYLSEWRHVQRGATWRNSLHMCDGRSPTPSELPSCYSGDDWSGCSLMEFMDCPYNLANNRQTRMLADLSLVGCYNVSTMSEEDRWAVILESAKRNLRTMAFFGLTEYQRETQNLFERTFNLEFIDPFTQFNESLASDVDVSLDIQDKISQLNRYDGELYEYARDLFLQRTQVASQRKHGRQQERLRLGMKQGGQQKSIEVEQDKGKNKKSIEIEQDKGKNKKSIEVEQDKGKNKKSIEVEQDKGKNKKSIEIEQDKGKKKKSMEVEQDKGKNKKSIEVEQDKGKNKKSIEVEQDKGKKERKEKSP